MFAFFALAFCVFAGLQLRATHYLVGDGWFYAATCISIQQDFDLDLSNQLQGPLEFFSSHLAMGRNGERFPKHPVFMPICTVPFLSLFGMRGFLIFNLLAASLAALVLFETVRRDNSRIVSLFGCLAITSGTFFPWYLAEYSPDVFSSLLVLTGFFFLLGKRTAGLDGLFLSLSLLAKPTNLIFWTVGLGARIWDRNRRNAMRYILLSLPAAAGLAGLNLWMFGSPLTSGYDRIIMVDKGRITLHSQREDFDLPVLDGIKGQLLHPRKGLLPTSPILLAALPGFIVLFRRNRRTALIVLISSLALFAFFSTYRFWDQSNYGNRFLLTPVLLFAIPIASGLQGILDWARARDSGQ